MNLHATQVTIRDIQSRIYMLHGSQFVISDHEYYVSHLDEIKSN